MRVFLKNEMVVVPNEHTAGNQYMSHTKCYRIIAWFI